MKEAAGRHIDEKMPDARDSTTVAQNYLYISGYNQGPIDDKGLEAITAFYDAQIQRGVKGQPRFIYSHDMPDPVHDAPQDVILHHIDQLAPVVAACPRRYQRISDVLHRRVGRVAQRVLSPG